MNDPAPPLPHQRLRAATQASHERVDLAYGRFDLGQAHSYGDFLVAHGRVLPGVEAVLGATEGLPRFTPRSPALLEDLRALGRPRPAPVPVPSPRSAAEAWAMLYVVEGSRLGGVMLARSVGPGLPHAYLSAGHERGGWRAFLAAFDAAAMDSDWVDRMVPAARAVFDLYAESATLVPTGGAGSAGDRSDPGRPGSLPTARGG